MTPVKKKKPAPAKTGFSRFDFSAALEKLSFKTLAGLVSVKTFVLVSVTLLLLYGKVSEGTWQETVLITAGLKTITDVSEHFKKKKTGDEEKESEA